MARFKIGDTVRCLRDSWGKGFLSGSTYVVSYFDPENGHLGVAKDSNGQPNGWASDNFELVVLNEQPFIKTIPPQPARRSLVDYKLTTINHAVVEMFADGRTIRLVTEGYSFEASDIAELIEFLTKVKEVLEENANANS